MSGEVGRMPFTDNDEGEEPDPYEGLDEEQIDYLNDPTQMSRAVAAQLAREYPQAEDGS